MKRAKMKRAEWRPAEQRRDKSEQNSLFSVLNPFLLSSNHADIKLPLSRLRSEGGRTVEKSHITLVPSSLLLSFNKEQVPG